MAHFMAIIQGSKGETSRLGGKESGIRANINGWNSGIQVIAYHENGKDKFKIFKTGGSNARTSTEFITEVS